MNIGEKIRLARTIRNYGQEYMATKLGVTQKTYSLIENNQAKLNFQKLNEIATILELDLEKLLSLDENNVFNNTYNNNSENNKNFIYNNHATGMDVFEKQLRVMRGIMFLLIAIISLLLAVGFYFFK